MKNIYELVAEKDQRNIEELKHRIELANLLADEVDDLIFSGKQITRIEWKTLKKTASRNKAFLVKVHKDPKLKVFLHLQENQGLETTLLKQLERSLVDAIDRLTASINVIDNEIKDNEHQDRRHELIATLKDACNGPGKFEAVRDWFVNMGYCDPDTLFWKDKKTGHKKLLASYLWDLPIKNYTHELTPIEIQMIAQNSFNVNIGISTIDHADKNSNIPSFIH